MLLTTCSWSAMIPDYITEKIKMRQSSDQRRNVQAEGIDQTDVEKSSLSRKEQSRDKDS